MTYYVDIVIALIMLVVFWGALIYFGLGKHHGIRAHQEARRHQAEICKKADDDTIDDEEWDAILETEIRSKRPMTEGLLRAHEKRERRHGRHVAGVR